MDGQITILEEKTKKLEKLLLNVLLASGAQIVPSAILQQNLLNYWQSIQHRIVEKKFGPAFATVNRFVDQCEQLQQMLAAPEHSLNYDWKALRGMNVANIHIGSTLYALDYEKLLEYFRVNHIRMVQLNAIERPDIVMVQKRFSLLSDLLNRIGDANQTVDKFDRCDSAVHSLSENGSEHSIDAQFLMALVPTSPPIDGTKATLKLPYRISLIADFHPIQQLQGCQN